MKKFFNEFKEFAMQGNVLDMAIGIIIGAAFKAIIDSVVNNMLMPFIGLLTGGTDFSEWAWTIGSAKIEYGIFISNVINFIIVALFLFMFVKGVNLLKRSKKEEEKEEEAVPEKSEEVKLLEEIRDCLKK